MRFVQSYEFRRDWYEGFQFSPHEILSLSSANSKNSSLCFQFSPHEIQVCNVFQVSLSFRFLSILSSWDSHLSFQPTSVASFHLSILSSWDSRRGIGRARPSAMNTFNSLLMRFVVKIRCGNTIYLIYFQFSPHEILSEADEGGPHADAGLSILSSWDSAGYMGTDFIEALIELSILSSWDSTFHFVIWGRSQ